MTIISNKMVRIALVLSLLLMIAAAVLVFSGVVPPFYKRKPDYAAYEAPAPAYKIVSYDDVPGWGRDNLSDAFGGFLRSCALLLERDDSEAANSHEYLGKALGDASFSGTVADWRAPCEAAGAIEKDLYADDSAWRAAQRSFFETYFQPVQMLDVYTPKPDGPARGARPFIEDTGLFTGYYEPVFPASRSPSVEFSAPLYERPGDLIDVDLGAFREDLAGTRIAGRIDGNRLIPYADHQAINDGALAGKVRPIAWMKPNDLFFLQIQGSG
ncbi:MAG TPA: MltA domain-containing protein, partial [Hyphomicrobiales bacterium]|nr:MltA domain-containing protein [Hyphomicrobiales bacterium]